MDPLISIIVPVYKVEKFLNRCIESLIQQTYSNLEIILVDDGSPDNCPKICDEWTEKDNRIVVYHKVNGGLSDARNYGIERANGEYIAFVDSDDYVEKDMYKTMLAALIETDCKVVCCGRFYTNGNNIKESRSLKKQTVFSDQEAIHELLNNGCIEEAAWDKVYAREIWEDLRYPVGEINEDIVVAPEIFRRSKQVVHVGKAFYHYCYNGESITKSGYNVKKRILFKHLKELREYIKFYYPQEEKYVSVLEVKYAIGTMYPILLSDDGMKLYKDDYKDYKRYLIKGYKQFVKSENISGKQKIEGVLLIIGIYKLVWKMMKKIK